MLGISNLSLHPGGPAGIASAGPHGNMLRFSCFLFFLLQLFLLRQNLSKRIEAFVSEFGKRRYLNGL